MKKILILGATGMLGVVVAKKITLPNFEILTHGNTGLNVSYKCDLSSVEETRNLFAIAKPDVVINLVALTNVDKCEASPTEAYRLNVKTIDNVVDSIKSGQKVCHLIHFSTDHLYDSEINQERNIELVNYYAYSKYISELLALEVGATVLRTNFIGRSFLASRLSFTDWIYDALISQNKIDAFNDVFFNPLSMDSLVEILEKLILIAPRGTYNLGSRSFISKSDLIYKFAEHLNLSTEFITEKSVSDAKYLIAKRPKKMVMDCSKIEAILGMNMPNIADEIARVLKYYDGALKE